MFVPGSYDVWYIHEGPTYIWPSPMAQWVKESTYNAGDTRDTSLIPGSGRSPGAGNGGNPL